MAKYPHIVDSLLTLENEEVVENDLPNETQGIYFNNFWVVI